MALASEPSYGSKDVVCVAAADLVGRDRILLNVAGTIPVSRSKF